MTDPVTLPRELVRILISIAGRCARADASSECDYNSMMRAVAEANSFLSAPGRGWSKAQMLASIRETMDQVPDNFDHFEACGAAIRALTTWGRIREGIEPPESPAE